jgi:alpha-L-fucosidase
MNSEPGTILTDRNRRMQWWRESRFGMFVHWGLYSQLGRHEWVMNRERIPLLEYEKLADSWVVKPRPARDWARLAKAAGMKYMVMTTKHHEGFCLWNTHQTSYNAVQHGPHRDLVAEYVDACREYGLRVGFYYSLMDWHHPDGVACLGDENARRRFIDFTQGCVRELCTQYGKLDILWYDVSWPLTSPDLWESQKMNDMVRSLQPDIIINNRSQLPEDFGTPEEHVTAEQEGRDWEACMTFNGSWGYMPYAPDVDWRTTRDIIGMLCTASAGQGNLLLNIGPAPDGSIPQLAIDRLQPVGQWLFQNGEAVYGEVDRANQRFEWMNTGIGWIPWSLKGNTAYYWCGRWPGEILTIGGLKGRVIRAELLATGAPVTFTQIGEQLILSGLPEVNPDDIANVSVIKLLFDAPPSQQLGAGYKIP